MELLMGMLDKDPVSRSTVRHVPILGLSAHRDRYLRS